MLDSEVPLDIKRSMVAAIKSDTEKNTFCASPEDLRLKVTMRDVPVPVSSHMNDFVDSRSLGIFKRFDLPTGFLDKDPTQWNECEEFQQCRLYFADMVVVNDVAERGVKLTQDYIGQVRTEEYFQDLLLVSQYSRRAVKGYTKEALSVNMF